MPPLRDCTRPPESQLSSVVKRFLLVRETLPFVSTTHLLATATLRGTQRPGTLRRGGSWERRSGAKCGEREGARAVFNTRADGEEEKAHYTERKVKPVVMKPAALSLLTASVAATRSLRRPLW